jgi:hypothetical protein
MPCPGDLADVAQLQRSTILLDAPLVPVLIERREAQPNLGLLSGDATSESAATANSSASA